MTEFRHGRCASCGAQYRVPATFEADSARCRSCGGTVAIGPVQTEGAPPEGLKPTPPPRAPAVPVMPPRVERQRPPVPPKPAAPAKPPVSPPGQTAGQHEAEPPRKKREGPSMKEQILARRTAGNPPPAPASKAPVPAKPVASVKPVAAARPGAPERAVGAASARPAPREHVARSAQGRAEEAKDDAADDTDSGRSRGSRAGRERRARARKKGNPALMLGSIAGLVLIAAAAWLYFARAEEGTGETLAQAPAEEPGETPTEGDTSSAEGSSPKDAPAAEETEPVAGDAPVEESPKPQALAKEEPVADPSSVDLNARPDFGPADGTSDEQWVEIQQLVVTGFDLNQGAPGNRARIKLEGLEKPAFPAVLNAMKRFDYATDDGLRQGDLAQRLLEKICNGTNFGWKYTTEPKDVLFNKKVVVAWATQWDKAKESEEYWLRLTKQKAAGPEGADTGAAPKQSEKDAQLDALDDL